MTTTIASTTEISTGIIMDYSSNINYLSVINPNMTQMKSLMAMPREWDLIKPTLDFPKISTDEHFKMSTLLQQKNLFIFNFLHQFLIFIQPDIPTDFLRDALENRVTTQKLIIESMHMEVGLLTIVGVCCILACVIPGTEVWLACRPIREDYKPTEYPGFLAFILYISVFLLGIGIGGMFICNEMTSVGIKKIPVIIEAAIEDLNDYHTGTTLQLRKCLTRSLDVANEAMMADLDNVEELLGKPVQLELAGETGIDIALERLLVVANVSQELSQQADRVVKEAERARDLGIELSHELNTLRHNLEIATSGCSPQDRPLCATINPSGLALSLRIDRLLRDERLQRLRGVSRDNLTEAARQARGEYFYVPHHIARNTLEARNQIRREINGIRRKIFEETRDLDTRNIAINEELKSLRKIVNYLLPHVEKFEEIRWIICIGGIIGIFIFWILILSGLLCRSQSADTKIRPTLLCGALLSCVISIGLWAILLGSLVISTHAELLLCRPLEDPQYRTLEVILESKIFLGRALNIPLKDLLRKCALNETIYPTFPLGRQEKLEQIADHWKWSGLTSSMSELNVNLKGLKIFTPNLEGKLESLYYSSSPNLTEHRTLIRSGIMMRDLTAMSDQVYNVARQIINRQTSRDLEAIGSSMRSLMTRKLKPLMAIHDELVDQLTMLEIHLRPFQRKVNETIQHLTRIQYYIDVQSEVFTDLKTKYYIERMRGYLDQWRSYILNEMRSGVAKCHPLWEIINGLKLLFCEQILGPLNGFWFVILLCLIVMMISTPVAHNLASVYRKESTKITTFTPPRDGSPDTLIIDRDTWRSPEPPPPPGNW
ncbi:hypothetical protein PV325_008296 [Microctonus aethiopoides]|nr:hypothetical protein PV325_008296 [Microctonus aethiopoides]